MIKIVFRCYSEEKNKRNFDLPKPIGCRRFRARRGRSFDFLKIRQSEVLPTRGWFP